MMLRRSCVAFAGLVACGPSVATPSGTSGSGEDTGTTSVGNDTSDSGMRSDLASTPDLPPLVCELPKEPNAAVTVSQRGGAQDVGLEYAWYTQGDDGTYRVVLTPTTQVFYDFANGDAFGYNTALGIAIPPSAAEPLAASYCYEVTVSTSTTSFADGTIVLDAIPSPGEPLLGAVMANTGGLEISGTFRALECLDLPRTPCG